jgi:hypothetical protein
MVLATDPARFARRRARGAGAGNSDDFSGWVIFYTHAK